MDSLKINLKNEPFQKTTLVKMLDKKDFWGKNGVFLFTLDTLFGMITEARLEQPKKASLSILIPK